MYSYPWFCTNPLYRSPIRRGRGKCSGSVEVEICPRLSSRVTLLFNYYPLLSKLNLVLYGALGLPKPCIFRQRAQISTRCSR